MNRIVRRSPDGRFRYPWGEMNVGDKFIVPDPSLIDTVRRAASNQKVRNGMECRVYKTKYGVTVECLTPPNENRFKRMEMDLRTVTTSRLHVGQVDHETRLVPCYICNTIGLCKHQAKEIIHALGA